MRRAVLKRAGGTPAKLRWAVLAVALIALASCRRTTLVGSLLCTTDADCSPPDSICGPDGRCVGGCMGSSNLCVAGGTCDALTGRCDGAPPCSNDGQCDPPASVCNLSTGTCDVGCTLILCSAGLRCNPSTGHCCDADSPDCPQSPDGGAGCNSDSECVGAPANICSGGACVPGCGTTGCTAPLTCDTATGHCQTPACARDLDCDPGSYCTQSQTCEVLAFGGAIACAGGTKVSYSCAQSTSASAFQACVGAPGPSGCPYCIDGSCFHSGLCSSNADCHRGNACTSGLCIVQAPQCPTVVPLAQVVSGTYAAGKEVCVRGMVTSLRSGYDGTNEIRLDTSPYLFIDVLDMYKAAGVRIPNLGETVTVHGTVRWDAGHNDRELLPVDWVSGP
jgi:hypothetical protein